MYVKLTIALCAIGLSLYGRQAESMSPPQAVPDAVSSVTVADENGVPPLKPIQGVIIDWKERVIHAVGNGQAPADADPAASRLLAIRAAHADALRKLAAVVYGMHIDPGTTIDDALAPKDEARKKLRIRVEGLIRGAKEAGEPEVQPDGSVQVHLALPLDGLEDTLALKERLPKQ